LRPITGKELCRKLEQAGWRLARIHGSHHIYTKSGERKILTVPSTVTSRLSPVSRDA
jgi:predicted RNA binding protein YcfA (HicA-like mRNA interferase family)